MNYGIIAAGEGSRLAGEGVGIPKPLVKLNGEPMIERLLRIFLENDAERVCVIVNEQMTEVAQRLKEIQKDFPVKLDLVIKSTPSSMHSFYELSKLLRGKGRFIVTTVDTIFKEKSFADYAGSFSQSDETTDGMMAMTSYIDDEKPLYISTDSNLNITGFHDKPFEGIKYISGGIYGLSDKAFDILDNCINSGVSRMRNYQRALVEGGVRLKGFPFDKIVDVDHASDIATAEKFISEI